MTFHQKRDSTLNRKVKKVPQSNKKIGGRAQDPKEVPLMAECGVECGDLHNGDPKRPAGVRYLRLDRGVPAFG